LHAVKALFGSLMCLVLATSHCYGLKGGPDYGGAGNLIGQYAGILRPAFCLRPPPPCDPQVEPCPRPGEECGPQDPGDCAPGCRNKFSRDSDVGIFTIGVPQTGFSTGNFVMFTRGLLLQGSLAGVADGTLRAITGGVQGFATRTVTYIVGTQQITETIIVAVADGQIEVTVRERGAAAARLGGTAVVNTHAPNDTESDPSNDRTYTIQGFRQSSTPPTPSI
jgi:hypothetical protein